MKQNKLIAFIGFGNIGSRHFEIIKKKYKEYKYILISKNKITKKKYLLDFDYIVSNEKEAIKFKPSIVFICTPSPYHIKFLAFFIENNVKIFVEKPLSNNYSLNLNYLLRKIIRKKLICHVGYVLNYNQCFLKFLKLINKNNLGSILHVHSEYRTYLPRWTKKNYKKTVSANKNGGGVLLELSHEIDYLIKLFSKLEVLGSMIFNSRKLGIRVEESADVLFKSIKNFPVYLHLSFNSKSISRKCKIYFENGKLTMDLLNDLIIVEKNGKIFKKIKFYESYRKMYDNQIEYFMTNNIRKSNYENFKRSIDVLKIIEQIKKKKIK